MKEGFLIIDKPSGWTSHDVVAKMRGVLGVKKIGHLGTLDPISTGVLVLAVGKKFTKQAQDYMGVEKEYEVEMELGKNSDTYDADGEIIETGAELDFSESQIKLVMATFWGTTMQTPPIFSAKKINGVRAYKLARKGEKPEMKSREVEMVGSEIVWDKPFVSFKVRVSSGTYVRSLVHDVGEKLACGAIMISLRRTCVGEFKIEDAMIIKEMEDLA